MFRAPKSVGILRRESMTTGTRPYRGFLFHGYSDPNRVCCRVAHSTHFSTAMLSWRASVSSKAGSGTSSTPRARNSMKTDNALHQHCSGREAKPTLILAAGSHDRGTIVLLRSLIPCFRIESHRGECCELEFLSAKNNGRQSGSGHTNAKRNDDWP